MEVFTFTRVGDIDSEGATWMAQCSAFAASLSHATLLVVRGETQVETFLFSSDKDLPVAARHLGEAVGGAARKVEFDPELLACDASGTLLMKRRQPAARASLVDLDVAQASKSLATVLPPFSWAAISMRTPKSFEAGRHSQWVQDRMGTQNGSHHSMHPSAQVVSIHAGARSRDEVKRVLRGFPGMIGGFDYFTKPGLRSWFPPSAATIIVGLVWFLTSTWLHPMELPLKIFGFVFILAAGTILSLWWRNSSGLNAKTALKYVSRRPTLNLLPGRSTSYGEDGRVSKARSYPLKNDQFLLAAHQFAAILAPQAGAASGASSTKNRQIPEVFTHKIGPLIGYSEPNKYPAHLDANEFYGGLIATGEPGSGKSVLLRTIFAWMLLQKGRPQTFSGFVGSTNTPIVFEHKSTKSIEAYANWGRALGVNVFVSDLYDTSTFAIDMIPKTLGGYHQDVIVRATGFVDAMTYGFERGSIMQRSRDDLITLISGGIVVAENPELAGRCELSADRSFIHYANILCGQLGDEKAVELARCIMSEPVRNPAADRNIVLSAGLLETLFGESVTRANRRTHCEAPKSKLSELARADTYFARGRRRGSFEQVLNAHNPVVFNFGPSMNGQGSSGQQSRILASMLFYQMQKTIEQACVGWQQQNRTVSVFCDEISILAGNSTEVLEWMRDKGREFGILLFFATQYLEQVPPSLQASIMGYGTLVAFTQSSEATSRLIAQNLSLGGQEWKPMDVANLPHFEVVVRSVAARQKQAPFTMTCGFWEPDMYSFPTVQGLDASGGKPADLSRPMIFGETV